MKLDNFFSELKRRNVDTNRRRQPLMRCVHKSDQLEVEPGSHDYDERHPHRCRAPCVFFFVFEKCDTVPHTRDHPLETGNAFGCVELRMPSRAGEASGALSANTNLSRRRIATNSEIWFIISFTSSPTQCTNRVLRTGVNSGPACEAERKGALSPRNRGAVKKRKMQVTNTNDVKTASPGLRRVT